MTRDEIIRMAREAADPYGELGKLYEMAELTPGTLECFAALVAAAERGACAKIAARAAPQPPKLSDERILELAARAEAQWNAAADQYNQWRELDSGEITILVARAIEREILGGGE